MPVKREGIMGLAGGGGEKTALWDRMQVKTKAVRRVLYQRKFGRAAAGCRTWVTSWLVGRSRTCYVDELRQGIVRWWQKFGGCKQNSRYGLMSNTQNLQKCTFSNK